MENYCNFKPFDKVLVRYDNQHVWQIDFFSHYVRGVECPYKCLTRDFNQCIPYEGNEHLMDTANMPEITDLKNNILFGVELKAGYVLEFENSHIAGVIIPTEKKELAVSYFNSGWDYLKNININSITVIRCSIVKYSFTGGKVLWQKHNK